MTPILPVRTLQTTQHAWLKLCLTLCFLLLAGSLTAQDFPEPNPADDQIAVVNINEDDALTLATILTGVGEARALAIVSYREQNGPFASLEDLSKVAGIGPATIAANRDRMVLEW